MLVTATAATHTAYTMPSNNGVMRNRPLKHCRDIKPWCWALGRFGHAENKCLQIWFTVETVCARTKTHELQVCRFGYIWGARCLILMLSNATSGS